MNRVWNRKDLTPEAKVRIYDDSYRQFRNHYETLKSDSSLIPSLQNQLMQTPLPKNVELIKSETAKDTIEQRAVESLPKNMQTKGELLLKHLKSNPEIIKWNDQREVIYKGDAIGGSNLIDLIKETVIGNKRKKIESSIFDRNVFNKILAEVNTPLDYIKNKNILSAVQSYKTEY